MSEHLGTQTGTLIGGRYRLDRLVAAGGMAQVWEATDEVLARRVAVKILHPHLAADEQFLARFRREAVAAARLSHSSIVSIYDTCSSEDGEAIVMELVEGSTLRELLDERKWLEPGQAVSIIADVADALETAHRGGVVHRDIKPANILLSTDGRVLVADFGIAKAGSSDLTTTNTTLGTAKYLAPEQVEGNAVDGRADVFALGVVLYETLCGRAPFIGDTEAATALARLHQEPMRPRNVRAGISKSLEDVVLRALARDPDQRYPSAAAFRAALLAASRGAPVEPPLTIAPHHGGADATVATRGHGGDHTPTTNAPPTFVRTERGWLVPTVVIVLVATALIVAGIVFSSSGSLPSLPGVGNGNTATTPIAISDAKAFDPSGDGAENDDEAHLAIDGDASTFWQTQGYNEADITKLKPGVGLVVVLNGKADLGSLEVTSQTSGWTAQIYVADATKPDIAGWGDPVTDKKNIAAGTTTFDLGGHSGAAVLIWFTNLGNGSPGDEPGRIHGQIAEVKVNQK